VRLHLQQGTLTRPYHVPTGRVKVKHRGYNQNVGAPKSSIAAEQRSRVTGHGCRARAAQPRARASHRDRVPLCCMRTKRVYGLLTPFHSRFNACDGTDRCPFTSRLHQHCVHSFRGGSPRSAGWSLGATRRPPAVGSTHAWDSVGRCSWCALRDPDRPRRASRLS
jgi:hypothetical protein